MIALNNSVRSSLRANSSAGDEWLQSLTNTCKNILHHLMSHDPYSHTNTSLHLNHQHQNQHNSIAVNRSAWFDLTCTNTFCSRTRLSRGVNSHPGIRTSEFGTSGRSKNRYRHLTRVDGKAATVMLSMRLSELIESKLTVHNNIQPLLSSSVDSISRKRTIAQLAASATKITV